MTSSKSRTLGRWDLVSEKRSETSRSLRCDWELKVTRAFSEEHERLLTLKRERRVYEVIGML